MAQEMIAPVKVAATSSELRRVTKIFFRRPLAVIGLVIVIVLIFTAIFAPLLAPHDPYKINLDIRLMSPTSDYPLGTDTYGRDILTRIIWGARVSLTVGVLASLISVVVGGTLGLTAAYFGGIVYTIIMRCIDALMSIPSLVLMTLISATLGGGLQNLVIALGIGMISVHCRVMCGQALSIKQNDYVIAGQVIGASNLRIMFQHVLPNCLAPIIVVTTVQMGMVIIAEASLSFLGFGITEPQAAWGSMLNDGYKYLRTQPILSFAPGIAIMLVVFGFNMMGDGLRDALDPRLRGTL